MACSNAYSGQTVFLTKKGTGNKPRKAATTTTAERKSRPPRSTSPIIVHARSTSPPPLPLPSVDASEAEGYQAKSLARPSRQAVWKSREQVAKHGHAQLATCHESNGGVPWVDIIREQRNACIPFPLLPLSMSGVPFTHTQTFDLPLQPLLQSDGKETTVGTVVNGELHVSIPLYNNAFAEVDQQPLLIPTRITLDRHHFRFPAHAYLALTSTTFGSSSVQRWQSYHNFQNGTQDVPCHNHRMGTLVSPGASDRPVVLFEAHPEHLDDPLFQHWCNVDIDSALSELPKYASVCGRFAELPIIPHAQFVRHIPTYMAATCCGDLWTEVATSSAYHDVGNKSPLQNHAYGPVLRVPMKSLSDRLKRTATDVNMQKHALNYKQTAVELVVPHWAASMDHYAQAHKGTIPSVRNPMIEASFQFNIEGLLVNPVCVSAVMSELQNEIAKDSDDEDDDEDEADGDAEEE